MVHRLSTHLRIIPAFSKDVFMNSHLLNLIIVNVTTHNFSALDVGEDNTNRFGSDNYSASNFLISDQISTISYEVFKIV